MYSRLALYTVLTSLFLPTAAASQRLTAPASALMDEVLHIHISGLLAGQRVTVRATMPDSAGRSWRAEADFMANSRGEISLDRDAAIAGSYTGVDPMGLITSMDLLSDPGGGIYIPPSLLSDVPVTFVLVASDRSVDSIVVQRRFMSSDVRVAEVREPDGPIGTLFLPLRPNAAPAVLVLGGSEGGNSARDVAAQLASHGYVTLSLAYFGAEPLPRELDEIPLEYFARAITYLSMLPQVDTTAIALFGTSKGAEAALLVATRDARVRAVVAYAPTNVVWSCICSIPSHSSWSLKGQGVPSVPPGRDPSVTTAPGQPLRPVVHYRYRMFNLQAVTATIPVEQIKGPVMLVAGNADDLWPSGEMALALSDRLAAERGRVGDTVLIYPQAGHRIGKSFLPAGSTRIANGRLETGGSARANAVAQADAWPRVIRFLSTVFHHRTVDRRVSVRNGCLTIAEADVAARSAPREARRVARFTTQLS
jgi:dienelactone hydrolase